MAATGAEPDVPQGVHHYSSSADLPDDLQKYWHQRYNLFSKYDQGVWLTHDAWFGVTPEPVANKIAQHLAAATPASKDTVVDAFAGVGGNAIAFALSGRWSQVFAIERDPHVLACAKHNAALYGVQRKIWWLEGDCFELIKGQLKGIQKTAVVFASPPWGGPSYSDSRVFKLSTMQPYSLRDLYSAFTAFTRHVVLYLPRSSDLNEIAAQTTDGSETQGPAHDDKQISVTHYCVYGASKALCVYYGDFHFGSSAAQGPDGQRKIASG